MAKSYAESESNSNCSFKFTDNGPLSLLKGPITVYMLDKHKKGKFERYYLLVTKPIKPDELEDGLIEKVGDGEVLMAVPEEIAEQIAFHLDMSRKKEYSVISKREGSSIRRCPETYIPQTLKAQPKREG